MRSIKELEDLKEKILTLINQDEQFAHELYRAILQKYGKDLLTKTYLDEALAKQSEDLKKEFYQALAKQSEDLKGEFYQALAKQSEEFDKKLAKQSEDLKKEFYQALAKQSEEFDKKLQKQSEEFDKKLQKQSEEFDKKLQKQSEEFDKKLQKQSEEFDKKLQKLSEEFDKKLAKQTEDLKNFIDRKFGIIGERWGINAEYTIHNFAKELTSLWGGKVKKWKKKVEVQVGKVTIKKEYEIDIVITDGKEILVEVKSSCDRDDVEKFIEAVAMYEEETNKKVSDKVIVAFFAREDAKIIAEEYGIKIINV